MQNHKEVIEEDKRNKLPANWESRKRQAEWIMQDEAARKEAEAKVSISILYFDRIYTYNYFLPIWYCFRVKIMSGQSC